jgi:hypothetical protein
MKEIVESQRQSPIIRILGVIGERCRLEMPFLEKGCHETMDPEMKLDAVISTWELPNRSFRQRLRRWRR